MPDGIEEVDEDLLPIAARRREMTKKERREQTARLRRFLSLSVELQEGALDYAERLKKAYLSKNPLHLSKNIRQKTIDR